MKNPVIIKGNKYGISIVLDKELEFDALIEALIDRLAKAEHFFDSKKQLAVTFEGREISNEELDHILSVIETHSKLNIQYVLEENSELETTFYDIIREEEENEEKYSKDIKMDSEPVHVEEKVITSTAPSKNTDGNGMFYKGILRSGQSLEAKGSLIIIGDVNPGAKVVAGGNIIIIGTLKGSVKAGADGNRNAFVMAMSMNPMQIQIANVIAKSADVKHKNISKKEAMIATVINDDIYMESITRSAIQEIMEDKR